MAETQVVQLVLQSSIATLSLMRPLQLNAVNQAVLQDLDAHLNAIEQNPAIRAVILRGEGRAFAAGADIAEMQALSAANAQAFSRLGQRVFARLEQLPVPTIALLHGYVLGGGMELALACDVRIAAVGTKLGQPEVTLGVVPGFGGSQRLPRIVGRGRALTLLLTGDFISEDQALNMGLVTQVVPGTELLETGVKFAEKLARLGPQALAWVKRAVYEGSDLDLPSGLAYEASLFGLCFSTDDLREGMSAFLEKRKPDFQGK